VPGITTGFRLTPTKLGVFPVLCAELCGLGHSVMRQSAHVVPRAEFDKWLADKQAGGQAGAGGAGGAGAGNTADTEPKDGKALFNEVEPKCASCHTLSDAGADATIGPNLDESLKGKDAAYIETGIKDPEAELADGFSGGIMPPNFGQTLKPEEIKALTDYLVEVATK